jgi:hypothetical protein
MKFQVWVGDLHGQSGEDSSYTINPVTDVLTIHWADGRMTRHADPHSTDIASRSVWSV